MSKFYDDLCNLFIRPTRQTYAYHDLGSPIINSQGIRKNFTITSSKNLELVCSYYKNQSRQSDVVVVYLHSFNGSRLYSMMYVQQLLEKGFDVCSFDFAGSGNSEGEYVSLGCNEKDDVLILVRYIQKKYSVNRFCFWGRSMGAVTAIKFNKLLVEKKKYDVAYRGIYIVSLVLDSPFSSLKQLTIEIAQKRSNVPEILIKAVFMWIQSAIEEKGNFKVSYLEMLTDAESIERPVLILASKYDTLVSSNHSEAIYKHIPHFNKQLIFVKGEHSANRYYSIIQKIYKFIAVYYERSQSKNELQGQMYFKQSYQSICNNNSIISQKEYSQEKRSKSLRRYATKRDILVDDISVISPLPTDINIGSSCNKRNTGSVYLGGYATPVVRGRTGVFQVSGIPMKTIFNPNTNPTPTPSEKKLKTVMSTNKNELRNKMKPTVNYQSKKYKVSKERITIKSSLALNRMYSNISRYRTEEKYQLEENHFNVISEKLRKKTQNKLNKPANFISVSVVGSMDLQDIIKTKEEEYYYSKPKESKAQSRSTRYNGNGAIRIEAERHVSSTTDLRYEEQVSMPILCQHMYQKYVVSRQSINGRIQNNRIIRIVIDDKYRSNVINRSYAHFHE